MIRVKDNRYERCKRVLATASAYYKQRDSEERVCHTNISLVATHALEELRASEAISSQSEGTTIFNSESGSYFVSKPVKAVIDKLYRQGTIEFLESALTSLPENSRILSLTA